MTMRRILSLLFLLGLAPMVASAQVTSQRIENAASEPQNWLTYSGTYSGQRYSTLTQINHANVKNLEQKWILQDQVPGAWESNPLVVDGIMYLTERPNDVMAVDARTGKLFWIYRLDARSWRASLLRLSKSWCGDFGRHVIHGHVRRAFDRPGRQNRQADLEHHRGRLQDGLFSDHGAPDCTRQSPGGRRWRRVWHTRLCCGF